MEFVLQSLNNSHPQIKSKIPKIRHIQSLFFYFLIVALIFFQLFQNHNLKQQLKMHRSDLILEELLEEKLPLFQKQIQEIRKLLNEHSKVVTNKIDQNKDLIRFIGRQLGLPLFEEEQNRLLTAPDGQYEGNQTGKYQVIQMQPNQQDDLDGEDQLDREVQEISQFQNIPQQLIVSNVMDSQSSDFVNYIKIWQKEHSDENDQNRLSVRSLGYQINISYNDLKEKGVQASNENYQQIKKWIEYIMKVIIIIAVFIFVFRLVRLPKKSRKQPKTKRNIWKHVCVEEKKKFTMNQKQLLCL